MKDQSGKFLVFLEVLRLSLPMDVEDQLFVRLLEKYSEDWSELKTFESKGQLKKFEKYIRGSKHFNSEGKLSSNLVQVHNINELKPNQYWIELAQQAWN